ncbi:MAG: hypothetical protein K0U24_07335 [Gammaproteobacteria bacterium]|nr:hypothetical protein [Gammaproteobacteria bacterium]
MPTSNKVTEKKLDALKQAVAENNAIIQDASQYIKKHQRSVGGYCGFKQSPAVKEATARKAKAIKASAKLNSEIEQITTPVDAHMPSKYESQKETWEKEQEAIRQQQEEIKALNQAIQKQQVHLYEQKIQLQQLEHVGNIANGIVTSTEEKKLKLNQTLFSLLSEAVNIDVDKTKPLDALQEQAIQLGEARQTVETLSHRPLLLKLFMMVVAFLSQSKTDEKKATEHWLKEKRAYNKALNKAVEKQKKTIKETKKVIEKSSHAIDALVAEKDEATQVYELKELEDLLTFREADEIEKLKEKCEHDGTKNPANHLKTALLQFLNQRTTRAFNVVHDILITQNAALHDEDLYYLLHEVGDIYPELSTLLGTEEALAVDNQAQLKQVLVKIGTLRTEQEEVKSLLETAGYKSMDTQDKIDGNITSLLKAHFLALFLKQIQAHTGFVANTDTTEEEIVAAHHLLEITLAKINDISNNLPDSLSQPYKAIFDIPHVEQYDNNHIILALCYQSNPTVFCEQFGTPKKNILEHLKVFRAQNPDTWSDKESAVLVSSAPHSQSFVICRNFAGRLSISSTNREIAKGHQVRTKVEAALNQFETEIDTKTSEEREALYALYNPLVEKHSGIVSSNMQAYKEAAIEIEKEISTTVALHKAFSGFEAYAALKAVTESLTDNENSQLNEALSYQALTEKELVEQPLLMKEIEGCRLRRYEIAQALMPLEQEKIALQQGKATATPAEKTHQLIRDCETASTDKHLEVHTALKAFLSNPTKSPLESIKKAIKKDKDCLDTPETKRLIERVGEMHPEVHVMHHKIKHKKPSTFFSSKLGYFRTSTGHTPDTSNDNSLEPTK